MKKVGGFIAAAFAVKEVVNFTKAAINAASETQSAWTGLNSIVNGTGNSFKVAQDFITEYTKDGLVSVNEAVTSYKNLLSRGYDTSQIEGTMNALKDSASFGRQASYGLGEAVVTATEGLKNENSILVDNAGVTKNVAKMWDEYARTIGKTSNNLTQAEKIQAEYSGIMKETRFQTGDAIAYANTFSGQVQRLKASFTSLKVAVGKVVIPIAQLFIPVINGAVTAITSLFNGISNVLSAFGLKFQEVVKKNNSSVSNFTNGIKDSGEEAVKAAKKTNKAFANVDEINVIGKKNNSNDNNSGNVSNSVITPTIDESNLNSSGQKIKKIIEGIWSSAPVKAFADYVVLSGEYIWIFWEHLSTNFMSNSATTWNNIKDNVSSALSYTSILWTSFWSQLSIGLQTWGQPIIDGVNGIFNSIWQDVIDPVIQQITIIWNDFAKILLDLWDEYGVPLVNNIGEFATKIISLFQSIWDNVLEPIITPFLEMMSWLWDKHLKGLVEEVGHFVGKLINGALEIYNKFISPIINFLLKLLAPAFSFLGNLISGVFGTVIAVISDVKKSVFQILGGIIDFISGIFTGNWKKAWQGVVSIFGGVINRIVGIFKAPINLIIDGINAFIGGLNKIKIPDWVPVVGGKGFHIDKIPKLYQGGYVDRNNPQLAIVGDNTREGEIITPESKIYDQALKAIKDSGGAGKQEIEITIYHKYEDGKTIIQKINQAEIDAGKVLLLT